MSTPLLPDVLAASAAGLAIIPVGAGKKPTDYWKPYQTERPTEDQLHQWFARNRNTGMAVLGGATSGGLEVLDIEDDETWTALETLIADNGLGVLWERIKDGYLERAPSGGRHVLYRAPEIKGNTKIAHRLKLPEEMEHPKDKIKTLIETRGEGGYAIIAPSHGAVHPTGKPYTLERGGFTSIVTIDADEHDNLLSVCRILDQMPEPEVVYRDPTAKREGEERPVIATTAKETGNPKGIGMPFSGRMGTPSQAGIVWGGESADRAETKERAAPSITRTVAGSRCFPAPPTSPSKGRTAPLRSTPT